MWLGRNSLGFHIVKTSDYMLFLQILPFGAGWHAGVHTVKIPLSEENIIPYAAS
jgi:hypothetical protein